MKKLFVSAVACMFAVLCVQAQTPEEGTLMVRPMAGISLSFHNYSTDIGGLKTDAIMKVGFTGGAEVGYQVLSWLQPSVGVFYSQQGSKYEITGRADETAKTNYLTVPVLANFYIADGLALKTGFQPGFLLSSKTNGIDVMDATKKFQIQIPIGISYEYQKFIIDARMAIPVTKTYKKAYDDSAMNNTLSITVGYNFEL